MACPTWLLMLDSHSSFVLLQIFHDPIWGIVANHNVYLTLSLHEAFHVKLKMKILITELLHIKFN